MERRMIAPGFVTDAADCLKAAGHDPAPLLAGLGIASGQAVGHLVYGQMWRAMAAAMQDEFFGLAARPMRPGSFVLMAQAALPAGRLDRALRRAVSFLRVVLDDPAGELRVVGGEAEIVLRDAGPLRPAFAYRTYWLVLMGLACWLVGRRIPLIRVDFACAAPENRSEYGQFFGAPVQFGQPVSRLRFDARYLALPVVRDEAALAGFLRGAPANFLLGYRQYHGLAARVTARLRSLPMADWPGPEALAAELGLAPATLRRRLKAEGQSFAAIRDRLRLTRAQDLLAGSPLSVAGVAAELGYSEPSAFHRAFLGWTGLPPGAWRDQARKNLRLRGEGALG
ncbi:AraC family transcriptional regulator [Gemmobacter denitrificans]|uniref:AraC family transcriptional regulator n=1 Tax=Gemmobacter denitrificans TaxID=3123040 RepID=A0ABU8BZQ9_9RHOB